MDFLNNIDLNYVYGFSVIALVLIYEFWGKSFLKLKKIDQKYFNLLEQALLLGGQAFKSEKVVKILLISLDIVSALEDSFMDSEMKHEEAVKALTDQLYLDLGIKLEDYTVNLIVHLAVAFMNDKVK